MCKDKQTIHYCTILSTGQWDFLLKGNFRFQAEVPASADDRCGTGKNCL